MTKRSRPPGWCCLGLLPLLVLVGCARNVEESLVVATNWPDQELAQLDAEWTSLEHAALARIQWVQLNPWDDPERLLASGRKVDVVLGGPPSTFARLAEGDWIEPLGTGEPDEKSWVVVRQTPIGLAARHTLDESKPGPGAWPELAEPIWRGRIALGDPRRDPITRQWAWSRLTETTWAEGYAELIRVVGNTGRVGSGALAVARGEAELAPAVPGQIPLERGMVFLPIIRSAEWAEGGALVRGSDSSDSARKFLQFLEQRHTNRERSPSVPVDPMVDALLADLLGSIWIDAHPELVAAWEAILAAGQPQEWEERFNQAPPWPPGEVLKLQSNPDRVDFVDILAEQIAPETQARAWLLVAWDRPPQPLDAALLTELATAAEGRLVLEPRFRAWLRAEWTAWARKWYRWIARQAVDRGQ